MSFHKFANMRGAMALLFALVAPVPALIALAGYLVWLAPISARQAAEFTFVPLGLISAVLVALIALRRITASPSRHSREAFAR